MSVTGPPVPTKGSPLTLSTPSPLWPRAPLLHVFYWDGQVVGAPQGSPQLLVSAVGVSHSGNYSCQVHSEGRAVRKTSARLRITVGSAPVTFTWLHNGQEVAQGPLLELGAIDVGHSGTYQCVATNQLGQDGHRVFRALSPEGGCAPHPHHGH
uniref:Uncharacterized protein n=1 Tax=Geospiza parvula TaxID=87175 RepID=A0A8U8BIB0_GEOPR